LMEVMRDMGVEVSLETSSPGEGTMKDKRGREITSARRQLVVSLVFTIPLFLVAMVIPKLHSAAAMALMANVVPGVVFSWHTLMMWLLATPVQFGSGSRFYKKAYKGLRNRNCGMDFLIVMGTSVAYFYSAITVVIVAVYVDPTSTDKGAMKLAESAHFFETAAMLISFVLLGKFLEALAKARTSAALSKLAGMGATTAMLIEEAGGGGAEDGQTEREIPIELLEYGDILKVVPGSKVPTDGVVVRGTTSINEAMLTGEACPVSKKEGDKVIGATLNIDGMIHMRVTGIGKNTALSQIVKLVEDAQMSKAPIQAFADWVSGIFAPFVVVVAIITLTVWLLLTHSDTIPSDWYPRGTTKTSLPLIFSISVVVIACPCALGLATPTAVMVGTTVGAKYGILIKGGGPLEMAHRVTDIVFDKTGTLTVGDLSVTNVFVVSRRFYSDYLRDNPALASSKVTTYEDKLIDRILFFAGSAEKGSEHPLARAIVLYATREKKGEKGEKGEKCTLSEPTDVVATPGKGMQCKVQDVDRSYQVAIGNRRYIADLEAEVDDSDLLEAGMLALEHGGKTAVILAVDGQVVGVIGLRDTVKANALATVKALEAKGVRVWMLTGDNERTARIVAKEVGIQPERVVAEVLPHQKAEKIQELQQADKITCMVGDGVNDSPALAQAHLGIAIGAGADVAVEAADMVLVNSNITDVLTAIDLSRCVFRRIRLNFVWALGYNSLAIPIACGCFFPLTLTYLPPEVAGIAMALSSVSVVVSSLFLYLYKPPIIRRSEQPTQGNDAKEPEEQRLLEPAASNTSMSVLRTFKNIGGSVAMACPMQWGEPCCCDPARCQCEGCEHVISRAHDSKAN